MIKNKLKKEILKKYIKYNYDTVELATQGYGFDVYSVKFSNNIIGGLINDNEKRIIYIDNVIAKKLLFLVILTVFLLFL